MSWYMMLMISVGLSADAFAISVAEGAVSVKMSVPRTIGFSLAFGMMSILCFAAGLVLSQSVSFSLINIVQDGVSIALLVIGLQMIVGDNFLDTGESGSQDRLGAMTGFRLFALMFAANLDVAAVSVILPWGGEVVGGATIGLATAGASMLGLFFGKTATQQIGNLTQVMGGAGLLAAGCARLVSSHQIK
ncbi:manganese efflux pump [Rubripirellula amarantea]|nr:manganese efflux pump [Rubripirellula amarantea]